LVLAGAEKEFVEWLRAHPGPAKSVQKLNDVWGCREGTEIVLIGDFEQNAVWSDKMKREIMITYAKFAGYVLPDHPEFRRRQTEEVWKAALEVCYVYCPEKKK